MNRNRKRLPLRRTGNCGAPWLGFWAWGFWALGSWAWGFWSLGLVGFCLVDQGIAAEVDYNRDVRPILSAKCFSCHGPDEEKREADLRLDDPQAVVADRGGYRVIHLEQPDSSELLRRITHPDAEKRMPPAQSSPALSESQIAILRRWIEAGAPYAQHWAFIPPRRPALPYRPDDGAAARWARQPIDYFVWQRLQAEGWQPAPLADPYTLVRRLYLDLLGIPPTPEQADAFVQDSDPLAFERLVDQLLASPQYGERWARRWLDLARYADTNGYEKDRPRSIWPYRDWVIQALNDDLPFDQFSIEQLAGDMLPQASPAQRIATGFHRNTMLNEEGGIDPLEYRFHAMVDRVAVTGTVWLGLTTGCAQCHSHKYDPLSHTDYYRLFGLLNNADEPDWIVESAGMVDRRQQIETRMQTLQTSLSERFPPDDGPGTDAERRARHLQTCWEKWLGEQRSRAVTWPIPQPTRLQSNLPRLTLLADGSIFSSGDVTKRDVFELVYRRQPESQPGAPTASQCAQPVDLEVMEKGNGAHHSDSTAEVALPEFSRLPERITALRLEVLPDDRLPARGPGRAYYEGRKGDFFLSEVTATADGKPLRFASGSHSFGKISIGSGSANAENVFDGDGSTGWSTAGREGESHQLVLVLAEPLELRSELHVTLLFERHFAASLGRFRLSVTSAEKPQASTLPVEIEARLATDPSRWTADQEQQLRNYFLTVAPELAEAQQELITLKKQLPEFPTTLVFEERPRNHPRPTYRHHRGEYLQPRERVEPGLPTLFLATHGTNTQRDAHDPTDSHGENEIAPQDRLGLARWLVSDRNPLVGRVIVNRVWQDLFGYGLVRTDGDFGTLSEAPTHPELLDWLAVEWMSGAGQEEPQGDKSVSTSSRELQDQPGLGWSIKQLHRLIVTSATYRQQSHVSPERLTSDPTNRLLGRGPRLRVDAEVLRDSLLLASGLLTWQVGGPSVYPPQPASVTALAYGNPNWPTSTGAARYRRSLYTFSRRTAPFAAYTVFDGPTGEGCLARRDRSNTPLQALSLMNDEMFLEMARALASWAVEAQSGPLDRATFLFRRILTRPPSEEEQQLLLQFHAAQLARLQSGDLQATGILADSTAPTKGPSAQQTPQPKPAATEPLAVARTESRTAPSPTTATPTRGSETIASSDDQERAAWVLVARALMNLDEAITKP